MVHARRDSAHPALAITGDRLQRLLTLSMECSAIGLLLNWQERASSVTRRVDTPLPKQRRHQRILSFLQPRTATQTRHPRRHQAYLDTFSFRQSDIFGLYSSWIHS